MTAGFASGSRSERPIGSGPVVDIEDDHGIGGAPLSRGHAPKTSCVMSGASRE